MKNPLVSALLLLIFLYSADVPAQPRSRTASQTPANNPAAESREIGSTAVVMDETLSVLRVKPSLFSEPIQRMQRGRQVKILGIAEADGVKFYRVAAPPRNTGWVQADAVVGKFRTGDEQRLAALVQAADGFDQIELARAFLDLYPQSHFRPAILLLFGDLLEEVAAKLTKDASARLDRRQMAASAAPMHSYYLNFVSIDRYRRLGIIFLFNPSTRHFHYDGASWREIVTKFPAGGEVAEAKKRLELLKQKMEKRMVP